MQSFKVNRSQLIPLNCSLPKNLRFNFRKCVCFCYYFYAFCSFYTYWHWVHGRVSVLYIIKLCSITWHSSRAICWHSSKAISIQGFSGTLPEPYHWHFSRALPTALHVGVCWHSGRAISSILSRALTTAIYANVLAILHTHVCIYT